MKKEKFKMTKKFTFQKLLIFALTVLMVMSIAVTAIMLNNPAKAASEENRLISAPVEPNQNQVTTTGVTPAATSDKFINVSGTGSVKVTPDLAYISVGVTSEEKDSQTALANNNKLIAAVIDAVKKFNVDSKDIQTGSFSVYPRYNYDEKTGASNIIGYGVNNTITVTVRNLENLGKILDAAVNAGANNSTNISFDFSKKSDKYLEALKLATENAKKEAEAIASAFGGKNLTIVEVNENSSSYYPVYSGRNYAVADAAGSAVPVEKGQIDISASVSVKYSFE
jgi:uncharacterized protein YggE